VLDGIVLTAEWSLMIRWEKFGSKLPSANRDPWTFASKICVKARKVFPVRPVSRRRFERSIFSTEVSIPTRYFSSISRFTFLIVFIVSYFSSIDVKLWHFIYLDSSVRVLQLRTLLHWASLELIYSQYTALPLANRQSAGLHNVLSILSAVPINVDLGSLHTGI
jgi:hypothetical protein